MQRSAFIGEVMHARTHALTYSSYQHTVRTYQRNIRALYVQKDIQSCLFFLFSETIRTNAYGIWYEYGTVTLASSS